MRSCMQLRKTNASCGVRTHAQLPAVDLKSTPLTTRANLPATNDFAAERCSCATDIWQPPPQRDGREHAKRNLAHELPYLLDQLLSPSDGFIILQYLLP